MGYFMTKQSNRDDYNLKEFVVDAVADVTSLPTNCAPGSTCFVIATSDIYMLSVDTKTWKLLEL